MTRIKPLLIIVILSIVLALVVLFSSFVIWGVLSTDFDFKKTGTVYVIALIWIALIVSTLLSTLIDNIASLRKMNKNRRDDFNDKLEFELVFAIQMDFWDVFKISIRNTFKESVFYLLVGVFVLPMFQQTEFTEPFSIVNVSIILVSLGVGMIILSVLNAVLNYIKNYGSGKEFKLTISHQGIFFNDKRGLKHIPKSKLSKFQEDDLFLIFSINRFKKIYILKDLFEISDVKKIRKALA